MQDMQDDATQDDFIQQDAEGEPVENEAEDLQDSDGSVTSEIDDDNDEVENSGESKISPDEYKKHARRLEKKLKKELRRKNDELTQYQQAFANIASQQPAAEQEPQTEEQSEKARFESFLAKKEQEKAVNQRQAEAAQFGQQFVHSLQVEVEQHPDFEEVMDERGHLCTQTMIEAAHFLPNGASTLHQLLLEPEEATRISRLHPNEQATALVKFHTKKAIEKAMKPKKKTSGAPSPPQHKLASTPATFDNDVSSMSYEQYKAYKKTLRRGKRTR